MDCEQVGPDAEGAGQTDGGRGASGIGEQGEDSPAAERAPSPSAAEPPSSCIGTAAGAKTVLLADDEPFLLIACARLLTYLGYRVITAPDGWEALEYYLTRRQEIDAIVLDLSMPRMSGEECIAELVKCGCTVPIIITTASVLSAGQRAALQANVAAILSKPYHKDQFVKALQSALGSGRR